MHRHLLHRIDRLPPAPGSARRRVAVWGLSLMGTLLCMHSAQADGIWDNCVRATANDPLYYQWYPHTTVPIANDLAIGDVFGPWITATTTVAWKCTRRALHANTPVQVSVQGYAPYEHWNRFISHDGESYGWYRLGDDNWALGYIARWRATIDGVTTDWTPLTKYPGYQDANSSVSVTKAAGEVYHIIVESQIRFVKQNRPKKARNVLLPGYQQRIVDPIYLQHYQQVGATTFPGGGTYLIGQMLEDTITFTGGGSCTTPSVTVKLPTVAASAFSGPGSTLGTTPFKLEFQNCPAGYHRIGYYLTPTTAILDASQGVIALDSSSTATSVGLQLTDNNDTRLEFGPDHPHYFAYDPTTVNTYSVPLKVAYYQTTSTPVGSGKVISSVKVTVKYI